MRLLFCGPIKSPFINEDMVNLRSAYTVDVFNMSDMKISLLWILGYAFLSLTFIPYKVLTSDVVYIWFADYPTVPILFWANLFGKRSITNIGGYEVSGIEKIRYGNQLRKIRGAVSRWCIRNSTVVIVPSEAYKDKVIGVEPDSCIRVVPNAIDTEVLCNIPLPKKELVAVTAIYNRKRDWYLKGIPMFHLASLESSYPHRIIEGRSHGELIDELLRSKVYCQFSYTESCGVTVLEAMACGCIPVVTDVDDLPTLIGNTGIVVPMWHIKEARFAIEKAMTIDSEPARERARKFGYARRLKTLREIT